MIIIFIINFLFYGLLNIKKYIINYKLINIKESY